MKCKIRLFERLTKPNYQPALESPWIFAKLTLHDCKYKLTSRNQASPSQVLHGCASKLVKVSNESTILEPVSDDQIER